MRIDMRAAGLAAALGLLPAAAQAVTWTIDFGSVTTSFQAPAAGGPVAGLSVTLGGVIFDTPEAGDLAPVFDPVSNDFSGAGGGIFSYYRSAASGSGCPETVCLLEFENRVDPFTPPLWAAFPLEMGVPGGVFASGNYEIAAAGPAPIPLPAPLALMAAAAAALGIVRLRRA
jgi:hypothetical protein